MLHLNLIEDINEKYRQLGENPENYLKGLLYAKPITYWDYIQTDALLSLQVQRTTLPDEMVFIMYHQVNELLFKMILWEIDQVAQNEQLTGSFLLEKMQRISRYFDMLTSSFTVMGDGMEKEQYLRFRHTLTPASGFQSAQYRLIEFGSTNLINLIDYRFRSTIDRNTPYEHAYNHLYWQAAGKDHQTGTKSTLLRLFDERYQAFFISKIKTYNTTNLLAKYNSLADTEKQNAGLTQAMRHYDYTVNITWVMAHYEAAGKYLQTDNEPALEATGGSDWRKYMLPKYQRRIFFPELWTPEELENWGEF